MTILAITDTMRDFGTAAAIVLGIAGFSIGGAAFIRVSLLSPRIDTLDDKLTPSFTEEHRSSDVPEAIREFAEADTDPAIPVVVEEPKPRPSPVPRDPDRTDTEENDMPRQIENAKLEQERSTEKTYRTFTMSDGTVHRFEVKG